MSSEDSIYWIYVSLQVSSPRSTIRNLLTDYMQEAMPLRLLYYSLPYFTWGLFQLERCDQKLIKQNIYNTAYNFYQENNIFILDIRFPFNFSTFYKPEFTALRVFY